MKMPNNQENTGVKHPANTLFWKRNKVWDYVAPKWNP